MEKEPQELPPVDATSSIVRGPCRLAFAFREDEAMNDKPVENGEDTVVVPEIILIRQLTLVHGFLPTAVHQLEQSLLGDADPATFSRRRLAKISRIIQRKLDRIFEGRPKRKKTKPAPPPFSGLGAVYSQMSRKGLRLSKCVVDPDFERELMKGTADNKPR